MKNQKKGKRFSPNQIRIGISVEKEHKPTINYIKSYQRRYGRLPPNSKIYKHIVLNHLQESPIYYNKLKELKL